MPITPYVPSSSYSSLPSGIWSGVNGLNVLPWLPGKTPKVNKAPKWSTTVKRAASGRARRTQLYPYPLWSFELSYDVLWHIPSRDEQAILLEFFNTMEGQYLPFLFVDPSDNAVTAARFATGDGTTTVFPLVRYINSWVEPIAEAYSPQCFVNGTATSTTYLGSGEVQFAAAPAAGAILTWSGYFYFECCFDQDDLPLDQIVSGLWSGKSLKFTTERT